MQPFADSPAKITVEPAEMPFDDAIGSALARSILDSSPDCIKLIGLDGTLKYMNRNGMCAMEIDEFCGVADKPWPSLWPDEAQEMLEDALEDASLGRRCEFDAFCPTARGTPRWWNVNVAPIRDESGEIVSILATSRDVTDRVNSETALHERDIQLQSYAERLTLELKEKEALLERQSILSAEIDHRVKNSFALIGSILRLKMKTMDDSDAREALADAANRIATLSRVHEQLHSDVEQHDVALSPFMEKLIGDLSATLTDESSVTTAGVADIMVGSDVAVAIGLVTAELVSNALKHKLPDAPTAITVALTDGPVAETMTLRVADSGVGLPEGFDLNRRESLGMQICRTYANTLRGSLHAENGMDGGAVFSLNFPKEAAFS